MIAPSLRKLVLAAMLAVTIGLITSTAHAVDVNGRISGTVTDPSGEVVLR